MEQEIIEIENKILVTNNEAQSIIIKNQEHYDQANNFLKIIKGLQVKVKETFRPIIESAYKTHRESVAKEKEHLEPLLKAETLVKNKMLSFAQEQERIRQEMEKKLQAEAEKKRQEAFAKAEAARAEGKEAKAEKYEDKAAQIVAPQLAPLFDKGSAVITKRWHAEVTDLMALIKAIAAGVAPISLIEANMPVLNSQARLLKENMAYPGVKAVGEEDLSTRRS